MHSLGTNFRLRRDSFALFEIFVMEEQKTNKRQHVQVENYVIAEIVGKTVKNIVHVDVPEEPAQVAELKEDEDDLESAGLFLEVVSRVYVAALGYSFPLSQDANEQNVDG